MASIQYLRSFRVFGMAVFDFVGGALLAELVYMSLPSTPLGFHPRIHVYPAVFTLGELLHFVFGVDTPVTSLFNK